jgi:hypothetical protein
MQAELADDPEEALIDYEVAHYSRPQLDAAWRSICAHMITSTIHVVLHRKVTQQNASARGSARRWMAGEDAVVTFREACESVDVTPEFVIGFLHDRKASGLAINQGRRPCYADARRSTQNSS